MNRLLAGTISGFVATFPMTLVMQVLHRWPHRERDALPPQQITEELAERAGIMKHLNEPELEAAVLANHFGFGAAGGAGYAAALGKVDLPPVLKGTIWGMAVWLVSYLGWIPAANILPPATEATRQRNVLMIVAHLVWGISLAYLTDRLVGANEDKE